MSPDEDPRWHHALGVMRQLTKSRPDDPRLATDALHGLADIIVAAQDGKRLTELHIGTLVAVGALLWPEAMKEAGAQVQTLTVLGLLKPIKRGRL